MLRKIMSTPGAVAVLFFANGVVWTLVALWAGARLP